MHLPLLIGLRRSRRLDVILCVAHLLAAISVGIVLFPLSTLSPRDALPYCLVGLVLLLLIALSAWRYGFWRFPFRLPRLISRAFPPPLLFPERLRLTADGVLFLDFGDAGGGMRQARVLPDSIVLRHLLVLRLRIEDEARIYPLTLLPDQMASAQFRQLVVCLRWRVGAKGGTPPAEAQ